MKNTSPLSSAYKKHLAKFFTDEESLYPFDRRKKTARRKKSVEAKQLSLHQKKLINQLRSTLKKNHTFLTDNESEDEL